MRQKKTNDSLSLLSAVLWLIFVLMFRTLDDKLRWAFRMYDEDNSRMVDLDEMESVMKVLCSTQIG